jgi:hypothetical protein
MDEQYKREVQAENETLRSEGEEFPLDQHGDALTRRANETDEAFAARRGNDGAAYRGDDQAQRNGETDEAFAARRGTAVQRGQRDALGNRRSGETDERDPNYRGDTLARRSGETDAEYAERSRAGGDPAADAFALHVQNAHGNLKASVDNLIKRGTGATHGELQSLWSQVSAFDQHVSDYMSSFRHDPPAPGINPGKVG